jgi:hypothetical protein
MLTRGADIGYLGSTMPRSPSSSFGDGSVDLVYIPRRELLGVAGSCAVAAPISGDGLECFCLKSGVLGNEQPKQDHAVGLAVPITRRSCHLLLTAIFLACCLAAERRLPTHFTPFGGAFFQSTLFARVAVKSSTCATSTSLPAFHCSAWNAKLLHANSNVQ